MSVYGFIGTGNMGSILAKAVRKRIPGKRVFLSNRTREKAVRLSEELNCQAADNHTVAECADFIFLGVKPQNMAEMLADIDPVLKTREKGFVLVSMAAGLRISDIQRLAGGAYPTIRIMPNSPSEAGEGILLYTCGPDVPASEETGFIEALSSAGLLAPVPEYLMDAGSVVTGCAVAFTSLYLEAIADGAVACGMSRNEALRFAAQMLVGTGKLALEKECYPGILKDVCCSPGGATIQGILALERNGFRGAVMEAVIASYKKTVGLSDSSSCSDAS